MRPRLVSLLLASLALVACSTESKSDTKAAEKGAVDGKPIAQSDVAKTAVDPTKPIVLPDPAKPESALAEPAEPGEPVAGDGVITPAGAKFELLSTGSEPRQELRFSPPEGQSETMVLTMTMEITIDMGAMVPPTTQQTPPIKMFSTSTIGSVANGKIEQKVVFDRYELGEDASGTGQMMAAAMGQAFDQMKGFEQRMIYDTRGVVIEGDWTVPPGMDPQLAANLQNVNQSLEQAMLRLPEDAVGVGGEWKEISEIANNGLKIEQTATYEITAIDGKKVTVATDISQAPLSKKLEAPNLPPGVDVDLLDFESKGKGQVVFELDHMIPVSGSSTMNTSLTVEAGAGAEKQKVTTKIKMTMEISREDAGAPTP